MELMNELLDFMHGHLYKHIILIAVCITVTIIAMTIDLVTGIQKAKQRGEATTSTGLKKTATKARKYFTPFFTLCCIDILCSVVIPLPAFSMLWIDEITNLGAVRIRLRSLFAALDEQEESE